MLGRKHRFAQGNYLKWVTHDWYVDGIEGDDSNTGKDPSQAFATLGKLQSVMQSNQSAFIYPKSDGSAYLETLDLSTKTVNLFSSGEIVPTYTSDIISGYTVGSVGAKIDCRDVQANAAFSKTAGRTNVYQISVTFDTPIVDPMIKIWEDGVTMVLATSLANCDSTPGSYYVSSHSISPQTVYVHASNSSDITTNGKVYLFNKRHFGIFAGNGSTVKGFHLIGNLRGSGSLIMGEDCSASDCIMEHGHKHNFFCSEGYSLSRMVCLNAYVTTPVSSSGSMFVYNKNTATGKDGIATECFTISNDGKGGNILGWYGHINVGGSFGDLTWEKCYFEGVYYGVEPSSALSATLYKCASKSVLFMFVAFDASFHHVIDSCYMAETATPSPSSGVFILGTFAGGELTMRNCSFSAKTLSGGMSNGFIKCQASCTLNVEDNEFYITTPQVGYSPICVCVSSGNICTINASGNEVRITDSYSDGYFILHYSNGVINSDLNNFLHGGIRNYNNGVDYATIAAWQAAGYDVNSTVG